MKKWKCTCEGRYELWTDNEEYGEIAILYNNEIWYKNIYKEGNPKFSYSIFISGESKGEEIDVESLTDAQKQVELNVLRKYEHMIDMKKRSICEYEKILDLLS